MSNYVQAFPGFTRKKRICHPLAAAATVVLACHAALAQATVSTVVTPNYAKPYVALVNGTTQTPYLMYGVQLRIDALIGSYYSAGSAQWTGTGNGDDGMNEYFSMAHATGYKTVIVPVPWRYIESNTSPGAYSFDYVQNIINEAYANSLKVQLLWFGSDVCGYSDAPDYVMNTPSTYLRLSTNTAFLDLSKNVNITVEDNALQAMMTYITNNDPNHTVVVLGVENEPDGCSPSATQPSNWSNPTSLSPYMYAGGQFSAVASLVNKLAGDAKTKWSGITRCNLGYSFRTVDFANYRASNGTGVDMLGVDLYTNDVHDSSTSSTHNVVAQLTPSPVFASLIPYPSINTLASTSTLNYNPAPSNMWTNVAHQPEGGGQYANYDALVLSNFGDGAGSLIYELRTLQWIDSKNQVHPSYDLGVYRATPTKSSWTARTGSIQVPYDIEGDTMGTEGNTANIISFNNTIYEADQKLAVTYPPYCASFLLEDKAGTVQNATIGGTPITFQTWSGSDGFAMKDTNGDIILLSFQAECQFTIDPKYPDSSIWVGYYDGSNTWHSTSQLYYESGTTTVVCQPYECVRIIHS